MVAPRGRVCDRIGHCDEIGDQRVSDEELRQLQATTSRRVRAIGFDLGSTDLGPFGKQQTVDSLDWKKLVAFIEELLEDFRSDLDTRNINQTLRELDWVFSASAAFAMNADEGPVLIINLLKRLSPIPQRSLPDRPTRTSLENGAYDAYPPGSVERKISMNFRIDHQ